MAFDFSVVNCPTCNNTCIRILDEGAIEFYCACGRMGALPKECKKGTWFTNILEEEED